MKQIDPMGTPKEMTFWKLLCFLCMEETDNELIQLHRKNNDLGKRAKMFPVTFVIKARKG